MMKLIRNLFLIFGKTALKDRSSAGKALKTGSSLPAMVAIACLAGLAAGCGTLNDELPTVGRSGATVNGTVSKGILFPGTVAIFAVQDGVKSPSPLKTVPTDQDGKFTADLGQFEGPVVIEASGQYTDEASNTTVTIDAATPLHAAIYEVGTQTNGKRCAVTPLTDLAFQMMSGSALTKENIEATNTRVSGLFKLGDIVWTEPVRPDAATLGSGGVSVDQQAYTIALATLSQMAKNANGGAPASFDQIRNVIGSFKNDLSASPQAGLESANMSAFAVALDKVTSTGLSGFNNASAVLQGVGGSEFKLTLSAGTAPAGVQFGGIQGAITLPAGCSVLTVGTTEKVADGLFSASGNAAGLLASARFTAATRVLKFAMLSTSGFSGGDFATLLVHVPSGISVTADDFALSETSAIDTAGNAINITISKK